MSFLGGAECSTAANPLAQFAKHTQDDHSLQRDRLVGRGAQQNGSMRTTGAGPAGAQDNMMNDFLQQGNQLPQGPAVGPMSAEQLHREQFSMRHSPQVRSGSPGSSWAQEFSPGLEEQARMQSAFHGPQSPGFNPAEYARFQQLNQNGVARAASPLAQGPATMPGFQRPYGGGLMPGMMPMGMYNPQPQQFRPPENAQQGKGKGRMVELDDENWEAQFAKIDLEAKEKEQTAEADESQVGEREMDEMDRLVAHDLENETNYGDFESLWRGIQAESADARAIADHADLIGDNIVMPDLENWENFDGLGTHSDLREPMLGDYHFEEDNMFDKVSNPYEEGLEIMSSGGNLSLAALAFEAAVRKDAQHVDAWVELGSAQAQNEKEVPAIRALQEALKLDANNLPALMGLAVSYTNEGYDSLAYRTLERWLSVKYPNIIAPGDLTPNAEVGFTDRIQLQKKITDLFISAAQLSPDVEHMDPDVQVGLGVLFYGAEEYSKAVDCFSAALASRESGSVNRHKELHMLWNRLGATLANSGRSEEAIAAYEKALTLNPNFVRARYNLGVSCINIGCYEEAAGHLLGALAMHKVVEREGREKARELMTDGQPHDITDAELDRLMSQNQSTNLYDTLRRVFAQMNRRDLADRVVNGLDPESFRAEFDF